MNGLFRSTMTGALVEIPQYTRWGCEEFLIVARGTTADEAVIVAESLRQYLNSPLMISLAA